MRVIPVLTAALVAPLLIPSPASGALAHSNSRASQTEAVMSATSARAWRSEDPVAADRGDRAHFTGWIRVRGQSAATVRLRIMERLSGPDVVIGRKVRLPSDADWHRFSVHHRVRQSSSVVEARAVVAIGRASLRVRKGTLTVKRSSGTGGESAGVNPNRERPVSTAPDARPPAQEVVEPIIPLVPTPADRPQRDESAPSDQVPGDSPQPDAGNPNPDPDPVTAPTPAPAPSIDPSPAPAPSADPSPATPSGWTVAYEEDFSGSQLDTSRWTAYHNTYGDGNNELACLQPGNVGVGDGHLTITARSTPVTCPGGKARNYSSGFLGSRESGRYYPLYARYEIRAQVPHGQGLWPAFWLRHRDGAGAAEVDIMEYFYSQVPGKATQTLHFPYSLGANVSKKTTSFETAVRGTGGWHDYAVEIDPVDAVDGSTDVRFRFYIDDVRTHEYINTQPDSWNRTNPHEGWDIAINLAVGGNYTGHPSQQLGYLAYPDKCSLTYRAPTGGNPASCPTTGLWFGEFPAEYRVDQVRVLTRT